MKLLRSKDQYILIDRRYLKKMVSIAELNEDDIVLEVGSGLGNLTSELLKRAGKVYGIEKDERFVKFLTRKFKKFIEEGKLEIIRGDALKIPFPEFNKFVSNIPYSISSPLTFKLLKHNFELAVITYQKEFAERLIAKQGKRYGRLSVIVKAYCKVTIVDYIPPEAFRPIPKVSSAIVKMIPEPEIRVKNIEIFEDLVRFAFSRRRKKFKTIVREWCKKNGYEIEIKGFEDERADHIRAEVYAEIANSVSSK